MISWMKEDKRTSEVALTDLCLDINSKLTAILVSTQYLESLKNLPQPVPKLLDIIRSDAQNIYGMLSKLNAMTKKEISI